MFGLYACDVRVTFGGTHGILTELYTVYNYLSGVGAFCNMDMCLSLSSTWITNLSLPPDLKTLYPDLIYTNIYANDMRMQIRIGRMAVQWDVHGFLDNF